MPLGSIFLGIFVAGILLAFASLIAIRTSGAQPALGRRLAGPAEVKVGRLLGGATLPARPVRVAGRIRCREPLDAGDGERLVAFHRDVEARIGGAWRSLERTRETRSFELWDHDGSLAIDPADAAEPLIAIPKVWRGDPAELQEPHASALARLVERHGPATEARSVTRSLNVTDRLLVLARATSGDDGRVRLTPPEGGYLITNLAIPDAMRLLGGPRRRLVSAGIVGMGVALALVAVGGVGALIAALVG
jgi:hypothetical protein